MLSLSPKTVNMQVLSRTGENAVHIRIGNKLKSDAFNTKRYLKVRTSVYRSKIYRECLKLATYVIVPLSANHFQLNQFGFEPYPTGLRPVQPLIVG